MVPLKQGTSNSVEAGAVSHPRISFSADFPDEDEGFISLIPNSGIELNHRPRCTAEFEFRSSIKPSSEAMAAADELFSDGRMLPIWQIRNFKKLNEISRLRTGQEKKTESGNNAAAEEIISSNAVSLRFVQEDDPSPRPPKCTTVLLREFLRFRKQRDSSSTSTDTSESRKERKGSKEKEVKRMIRKGLERSTKARVMKMGRKGD
ncbi:uncharacterized protein LOC116015897 [Ipomoea triloba]|uniref:uncharacterized protein LOC116015897 n=1 Tax=Ipomoea triloba TaxID=35885 RepID=UPI00125E8ABC|nr:uncharacterized protein LOC116015897 [Ipomoea triloba]